MKEILKQKIANWGMQESCATILVVALAFVVILLFQVVQADRAVRCYYLHTIATNAGVSYQIVSDIDWTPDFLAFSSGDWKTTMEIFNRLPQCPDCRRKDDGE